MSGLLGVGAAACGQALAGAAGAVAMDAGGDKVFGADSRGAALPMVWLGGESDGNSGRELDGCDWT
jgi:hypothetical protein